MYRFKRWDAVRALGGDNTGIHFNITCPVPGICDVNNVFEGEFYTILMPKVTHIKSSSISIFTQIFIPRKGSNTRKGSNGNI